MIDPKTYTGGLTSIPGKSLAETNTPAQMATAGNVTPNPSGSLQNTMTSPTSPTSTSPFALAQVMDALQTKVKTNNALMSQRNLLLKQLYDQPLTDQEKSQLDPTMLQAINTNNRDMIDMNLRLISDEIQGRTSSLDSSVKYLTDTYQKTIDDAETQKQQAIDNVLNFAQVYGSNAKSALTSLFHQDYVDKLKTYGVDLDKFTRVSTLAERKAVSGNDKITYKDEQFRARIRQKLVDNPEYTYQQAIDDITTDDTIANPERAKLIIAEMFGRDDFKQGMEAQNITQDSLGESSVEDRINILKQNKKLSKSEIRYFLRKQGFSDDEINNSSVGSKATKVTSLIDSVFNSLFK